MNTQDHPARFKCAATYNAAADHFDAEPLSFWSRHGQSAVDLLDLQPGHRVLDVGCGTGASAIPAARAVGPEGHVLGVDLAHNMLERGRAKARGEGLSTITFDLKDMSALDPADGVYDAVISVFSIFFVEDVEAQVETLWALVRPGGKLVVTVWGKSAFEPAASMFSEEVRQVNPAVRTGVRPWERLTDLDALRRTLQTGGVMGPELTPIADQQVLSSPEDWWTIALGSGYRGEIEQLTAGEQDILRGRVVSRLRKEKVEAVHTNAIHALAVKPAHM